jgi:hypothetical protein
VPDTASATTPIGQQDQWLAGLCRNHVASQNDGRPLVFDPQGARDLTHRKNGTRDLKARLLDLSELDQRTTAAKYAQQVMADLESDLGGDLSTMERLMCRQIALASAIATDGYARWLKGENIAVTELSTISNTLVRLGQTIGFSRRAKDVTKDIHQYLKGEGRNA